MAQAVDVAKYILNRTGEISTMSLQKLVFYCHAYRLAWTGVPMIEEDVVAWTHGPVVYELFVQHRGLYSVGPDEIDGDDGELDNDDRIVANEVIRALGGLTGWELRNRTHQESPWKSNFRESDIRHNNVIPNEQILQYYRDAG